MSRAGKYLQEIREEAVRLVRAHRDQYESEWAAITSLASKFAATAETVRKWVQQADIADGVVNGVSSAERQQIKDLQREVPGAAS